MNNIHAAVVGATGYAGEELLKLLSKHPHAELSAVAGRNLSEPKPVRELYPHLANVDILVENLNVDALAKKADVVFLALPHKASQEIVPAFLKNNCKVIDLSADFRIENATTFEKWYGTEHIAQDYLNDAVYGLPELYRERLKNAELVANPGCYPTTIILGCAPAIKKGIIDIASIIVDSKSGVSGAGRKSVEEYYKTEHPNTRAYKIAGKHRHIPEVEQELRKIAGTEVVFTFTPHIIPVERGMLSTIYMNLTARLTRQEAVGLYAEFYKDEPFVKVLGVDELPGIKDVVNTNFCHIGLSVDERTNRLIVVSCIDNLGKGASGQAVENMNLMFGFGEADGLL